MLAGSLNLSARGTEIPPNDAQKLVNLAYDQSGGLRSRKGHQAICTASGPVKQMIHAMGSRWQGINTAYLVGFKKYVWKMGAGTADKACTTVISTAGARKSNGTTDWRWIPKAPTEKPTIATAADVITLVDDFSGGWTEEGAAEDDEPPEFDENGLFVQGDDDSVFSFVKDISLNLYDGYDKDDVFKIKLRAKKWSNVAGVSFDVDVGDGSFTNDVYKARLPLKEILAGRKETIAFYLRKGPLNVDVAAENKNRWGTFERIGQAPDRDWRSVVKLRVKVEFSLATRFWFTSWDMIGNEDNTLEGDDFQVCYTYTTEDEHESNPSPWSGTITVNRGSINVTDMVESADPQVTGQHVYLRGGTLGLPYRADGAREAADGEDAPGPVTGTNYTLVASADDLTNFNIVLEDDHDDPPDADGIAGPYYGRILAFKGSRFYWSHQNKPFAFTNPDGPDGDWNDIDENAGDIKHISIRSHEAWLYGENEVFVLVGDPADAFGEVHPSNVAMGTPSRTGVAKAGAGVDVAYFGSGIYLFDGSSSRKLSAKVEPIFQGRSVLLWDGTTANPISDPSTVAVGYEDGVVRVSHSAGTLAYNIAADRWVQDSRLFTCFQAEGESRILGGQSGGQVVRLEEGQTDGGDPIPLDFLSKAYDFGIQDNEKRVEDVTLYHDTAGQDLTLTVYYAEGLGVSTTINSFGRQRNVFQLNGGDGIRARNFAIQITGNISQEIAIDSIDFNYYSEAREAKSYDTQVSDAGTPNVKLIRELHADLENATDVQLKLETDVPSFALTQRETHLVTTNLFRRTEPIVMNTEVYGHDFRVVASGTGYFHMFGLRALVQQVGTYLHGGKGEYYLSDPLDFGSERVKLVREAEVVYSTVGTVLMTLSTDLPGNAIVSRGTATFPATIGEQSIKVRMSGYVKGRLVQVKLNPSVDCRVEAIRLRIKMIGEPSATPWAWVELPLAKTQDAIWVPLSFPEDQVA